MAIVVLVLWMFTAGAGFYLLITSSLGRARPPHPPLTTPALAAPSLANPPLATPSLANPPLATPSLATPASARVTQGASGAAATSALSAAAPALAPREAGRATKDRWAPPSLVASRQAPLVPSARTLVEFAHPTLGIVGLAFWLGFALVHNRTLGWIGFGLAAATACVGLSWLAYNWAAARRAGPGRPAPSFAGRLVALHGSAAAVTVALAALAALVIHG